MFLVFVSLRALKMSIGFDESKPKLKLLLERPLNGSRMFENRLFPFMFSLLEVLKLNKNSQKLFQFFTFLTVASLNLVEYLISLKEINCCHPNQADEQRSPSEDILI